MTSVHVVFDTGAIIAKGRFSDRFAGGINIGSNRGDDRGNTVLAGRLVDQSHLHGVINHLFDLGIEPVRLETIDDD
ncbi:MAG: hypothetical protein OEM84_02480 [Acidimicrobiia bacterium]|nr:hypothetical protein [Acidimicrobiia bacterium]MDH5615435.1 hypothetical protein [Acidimicrobiia bacterium]